MSDTKKFPGIPLFDSALHFTRLSKHQQFSSVSPDVEAFVTDLAITNALDDYRHTKAFLTSYSRKSTETYDKFRGDAERLLLWAWLIQKKSVAELRRQDLEDFIDFVMKPPADWVAETTHRRFLDKDGLRLPNPLWRPFRKIASGSGRLNNKSLQGLYSNLSVYFQYLMEEDYALGNPVSVVKKNCKYLIDNAAIKKPKRLSELQWQTLLDTSERLAISDPIHERTLFIIASLKSLKLRISELSNRERWTPVMNHFWRDHEGNWWFKAFGKGNKERDVSISSDYLNYLERYRQALGLLGLPSPDDDSLLIPALNGRSGLRSRQIRNLVEIAFSVAVNQLTEEGFLEDARELKAATTHWLRHTGASMEVAANRPLQHVQADLGHGSIRTTDELYVDSDNRERALTASKHKI
ncbi:tyrosine-type recombinase/integrase [Aestuariicella hydrocarbonica]|uniref:Tyrosine-type recombinase/integrase n=1 Tax=Pseudomaricurvus hydrocarbonicus TaxID=1470433 RepID=A0A9E5MN54_9GAMM|nr:tyrosine-type recombinase/integrase [Aestuariicella hydrocarbonica]NHO67329.1 tyrosine-type recombinase/integrase [Aestuariicella hydrocarbonica]